MGRYVRIWQYKAREFQGGRAAPSSASASRHSKQSETRAVHQSMSHPASNAGSPPPAGYGGGGGGGPRKRVRGAVDTSLILEGERSRKRTSNAAEVRSHRHVVLVLFVGLLLLRWSSAGGSEREREAGQRGRERKRSTARRGCRTTACHTPSTATQSSHGRLLTQADPSTTACS